MDNLQEAKVFICDSASEKNETLNKPVSYRYFLPAAKMRITKMASTSTAIYIMDTNLTENAVGCIGAIEKWESDTASTVKDLVMNSAGTQGFAKAHENHVNIGFVDGHVNGLNNSEVYEILGSANKDNYAQ